MRSRTLFLAEYIFAPDPLPTTDEEKQVIARLAVLKMKVDAGDKKALKEWRIAGKKIIDAKKKADLGDVKAKRLMQVLSESGIFDGVQPMTITAGDDSSIGRFHGSAPGHYNIKKVEALRNQARKGNKNAQQILRSHNLSW
jgi:hypothetical protein